ncbi:type II toxin-antitoxin system HicA family toxin [Jiella sonneratiae]|uniref:Type II toxin-antitoxin system HicA family toxin n=1 Tax=Jiella sonneratiae TaxID=2816856 RepID=A0ABS3J9W5_9HYPH|nr:type II toxin-antitoxin system HicA family toxin [Jiella sonneratiae]MBO0906462.1 type II toxin-antitoxin system HicA family toxin [Jiella sonneratiae]
MRALKGAGFTLHHVTGSHHVMERVAPVRRAVVVPVHGNRDIPIGTLRAIIKQAGMSEEDFIALL